MDNLIKELTEPVVQYPLFGVLGALIAFFARMQFITKGRCAEIRVNCAPMVKHLEDLDRKVDTLIDRRHNDWNKLNETLNDLNRTIGRMEQFMKNSYSKKETL